MDKGERMTVIQKCNNCNQRTYHTVVCESIDNGMENRLYTCDNCQHEEHNQVTHIVTFHDKLRKNGKNIHA